MIDAIVAFFTTPIPGKYAPLVFGGMAALTASAFAWWVNRPLKK